MCARLCLGAAVFVCAVSVGFEASAAKAHEDGCAECHFERTSEGRAPFVDEELIDGSIHSNLSCVACHSDAIETERPAGAAPHKSDLKEVGCAQVCHFEGNTMGAPDFSPMDQYRDSVHGLARRAGLEDAATCTNCHGRHNIRRKDDPESNVYRANIPRTCAACHEDMRVVIKYHVQAERPFREYEHSVHGRGVFRDGPIETAAVCIDCHGIHDIEPVGASPYLKPRRPETCGSCHEAILASYKRSTHGIAQMEKQNTDAPVCSDCHGEHRISIPTDGKIPSICSQCHAAKGISTKLDIPVDSAGAYEESYHGITGDSDAKTAANCASCHGYHDILPPGDPESPVHADNLLETCGQSKCHAGISANIASANIHVSVEREEAGGSYNTRQVFVWILMGLLVVALIWLAPNIARKFKMKSEE